MDDNHIQLACLTTKQIYTFVCWATIYENAQPTKCKEILSKASLTLVYVLTVYAILGSHGGMDSMCDYKRFTYLRHLKNHYLGQGHVQHGL